LRLDGDGVEVVDDDLEVVRRASGTRIPRLVGVAGATNFQPTALPG